MPDGLDVAVCMTRGASAEGVLAVSEAVEADLIVLSEHAGKTEDHASVIEFLLEHSRCPILALHDRPRIEQTPQFQGPERVDAQTLLVPVNSLTPASAGGRGVRSGPAVSDAAAAPAARACTRVCSVTSRAGDRNHARRD
jgi:hypothetical protein